MSDCMTFPNTVEEFMEQYKVVDTDCVYSNGIEFVPIFRMKQWFEHLVGNTINRQNTITAIRDYMVNPKVAISEHPDDILKYNSGLLSAIQAVNDMPSVQLEPKWIPCSERLPEEDNWLGGSGRQFSDEVLVSVANYDDENIWTYISQTIDGEWALELPRHCKIIAWMPLPSAVSRGR